MLVNPYISLALNKRSENTLLVIQEHHYKLFYWGLFTCI